MSARRLVTKWRTDWFRVLVDLERAGVNNADAAQCIDVPLSTLRGWKNLGSQPRHDEGYELLEVWMRVTGKDFADRPRTCE